MKIVIDRKSFARYQDHVDDASRAALRVAVVAATNTARSTESPLGYDIDAVKAAIFPVAPTKTRRGYGAMVIGSHPLTLVFEKGSYAKQGRARSTRSRAVDGNRGVKPVRMLRKGAKAGKIVLHRELLRRL